MTHIKNNSRNESVDTLRLFAVLFVIVVNTGYPSFPENGVAWTRLAFRWAIPFFFILNGYFLALKNENAKSLDVRAVIERLAWVFLIWNIIYLPVEIWSAQLSAFKVFDMLIAPIFIFTGSYYHLWVLPSLLFGYLFIAIMHRFNAKWLVPVISIISLIIGLIGGGYQIFKMGFILGFNVPRLWLSIPFIYMGMLAFQKGRPSWWVAALLVVFGAALQVFEAQVLYERFSLPLSNRQFLIGTIFFAYGMACLALHDLKFLRHPLLARWGREYSLGIYLIHPLISLILVRALLALAPVMAMNKVLQVMFPLVIFFLSLAAVGAASRYAPALYNFLLGIRAPSQSSQS